MRAHRPSDDIFYHEDWFSAPIEAAGLVFIKVSYSSNDHADPDYLLTVKYE